MRVGRPEDDGLGHCRTRPSGRAIACLLVLLSVAAPARAATDPGLSPGAYQDEGPLAAAIWERSPEVIDARADSAVAASEETRAHLLPNPQLDLAWGTI